MNSIHEIRSATRFESVADIRRGSVKPRPVSNARAIAYRRSLGLTQSAMAEIAGVSTSHWQRIERGERPAPESLRRMMGDA
jgi:DNA-binding transcriptional regulator YiaG